MFTINIKGKRDHKNIHFVKLEMVFYKRGYARVTKVIKDVYKRQVYLNSGRPFLDWHVRD